MNIELINIIDQKRKELDPLRPISPKSLIKIKEKMELDYNFYSNSIEGNTLTIGETNALIKLNLNASIAKRLRDIEEMRGHINAVEELEFFKEKFDKFNYPVQLSQKFIKNLHKLIFVEDEERTTVVDDKINYSLLKAGHYKDQSNSVLKPDGTLFVYSTPEETPSQMMDLIDWYNNIRKDINPVILSAIFHYKFIRIHPFGDGNGRMARLLMNYILQSSGYAIIIITKEDKANYIFSLDATNNNFLEKDDFMLTNDLNNFDPFVTYILEKEQYYLDYMIYTIKEDLKNL
jgi:Fic family protein